MKLFTGVWMLFIPDRKMHQMPPAVVCQLLLMLQMWSMCTQCWNMLVAFVCVNCYRSRNFTGRCILYPYWRSGEVEGLCKMDSRCTIHWSLCHTSTSYFQCWHRVRVVCSAWLEEGAYGGGCSIIMLSECWGC